MSQDSPQALLSAVELAHELSKPTKPVILDARWQLGSPSQHPDYLAGHIPGAQWCDLDTDLAGPPGEAGRHPLPAPERLQAAMRRWGVHAGSEVVVYDGSNSVAAARAWWVLRWAGHHSVRVLDGGLAAWLRADLPLEVAVSAPEAGTVRVHPGSVLTLTADTAAEFATAGRLVDVRAPERFRGELEPIDPIAGHIPGAQNIPTTENVVSSGEFAPLADLRARFAGIADSAAGQPIGVYCGSGVTAAHTALALHLVGLDSALYPGSWSEWITDPRRPIATG